MADEDESGDEDLQGAPPASSRAEQRERRLGEQITVNSYLSRQIHQLELMLLQSSDLFSLFEILKPDQGVDQCLLLPIMDSGLLVGSFHVGANVGD